MSDFRSRLAWFYLFVTVGINVFIVWEAFLTESTGHMHSMHGYLMAIADRAGLDRLAPQWWPYWGGGGPLEYTYAPLVPVLIALLSKVFGASSALAFHQISGFVYCLLPAVLFVFVWRLFRAPGWGFIAAMAYSLLSPTELIVPDTDLGLAQLLRARRLYVAFDWDEVPHLLALALLPLAAWTLARALRRRELRDAVIAGVPMAAMMLSSMFGLMLTALLVVTVPLALERRIPVALLIRSSLIAGAAYLLVCPLVPPSLLFTIRYNSARNGEGGWSTGSTVALLVVGIFLLIVWRLAGRYLDEWPARWVALFAVPSILFPVLDHYWNLHFLPQPGRYLFELEIVLALGVAGALRLLGERLPARGRVLVVVPLVALAGYQVVSHRAYAKTQTRHVDMAGTIEYRVARYIEENLPGERIMTGGSLCQWFNTYSGIPQLAWPHYPSAPNFQQQVADFTIQTDTNAGDRAAEYSILWMKAFGVHAIALGGPDSPEAWKAFAHPYKFEGVLEEVWREDDTMIYKVPQRVSSLAHAMKPAQLVRRTPIHGLDTEEMSRFVAALDSPDAAPVSLVWDGTSRASIQARLERRHVISVQVNYSPGWRASCNGERVDVRSDGIGLVVIEPDCAGDCEVTLEYDGGWEAKLTRAGSGILVVVVVIGLIRDGRARRVARSRPEG